MAILTLDDHCPPYMDPCSTSEHYLELKVRLDAAAPCQDHRSLAGQSMEGRASSTHCFLESRRPEPEHADYPEASTQYRCGQPSPWYCGNEDRSLPQGQPSQGQLNLPRHLEAKRFHPCELRLRPEQTIEPSREWKWPPSFLSPEEQEQKALFDTQTHLGQHSDWNEPDPEAGPAIGDFSARCWGSVVAGSAIHDFMQDPTSDNHVAP